jgi:hypothetical protein
MRSWILSGLTVMMGLSGAACSPAVQGTSACSLLSYYSDQTECQSKIGTGTCEMFTANTADQPVVCWRKKTGNGTNTNTGGGSGSGGMITPTPTPNPCFGSQVSWNIGAWSPASCGPGVNQQTRSVSCTSTCPCNVPSLARPVENQACTPDLYGNAHYASECTAAGGAVEWIGTSRICGFSSTDCPGGWQALGGSPGYIITAAATANEYVGSGKTVQVSTSYHTSYMAYREYKLYCSAWGFLGCKTWSTLYATIVKRACY